MTEETSGPGGEVVGRVTRLGLQDFRGFTGIHELDTDADIVLLTGPNGYGKTSLMDALLLVLTGHHYYKEPEKDLISLRAERCAIWAETKPINDASDGDARTPRLEYQLARKTTEPNQAGVPRQLEPELEARLCGFFQDRVKQLYDETSGGMTLRDVFEPIPSTVVQVQEALSELKTDLEKEASQLEQPRDQRSKQQLEQQLEQACEVTEPYYQELARARQGWPDTLCGPHDDELTRFATSLLDDTSPGLPHDPKLPGNLQERLTDTVRHQLAEAKKKARGRSEESRKLEAEIAELDSTLTDLSEKYPNLERELGLFSAELGEDADALSIFRSLARNAHRWGDTKLAEDGVTTGQLRRVRQELRAVMPLEAEKCQLALQTWLEPRRFTHDRIKELEAKKARLQTRWALALRSDEVTGATEAEPRPEAAGVGGCLDGPEDSAGPGAQRNGPKAESRYAAIRRNPVRTREPSAEDSGDA